MVSIATAILKNTFGLLVTKARDKTAEKLKDGDISDQKFRSLIVREIDNIQTKLDAIARKNLLTGLTSFKAGFVYLYQLFDKTAAISKRDQDETKTASLNVTQLENLKDMPSTSAGISTPEIISSPKQLQLLELTKLDESAMKLLNVARKRFEEARMEATRAFSNGALSISDRLLAMKLRVSATILEHVTDPAVVMAECRMCLDELHDMPAVREVFKVQMENSFKSWFTKDERGDVIASVYHINRAIYNLAQIAGEQGECGPFSWPCINTGKEKVDPLGDLRVAKKLNKTGIEHCCNIWSFGQEENEDHKLKEPRDIASNTLGELIVADFKGRNVNVFNSSGRFLYSLLPSTDEELEIVPWKVATDQENNVYVLVTEWKVVTVQWCGVYVFDERTNFLHKTPLVDADIPCIAYTVTQERTVEDRRQLFARVDRHGTCKIEVYKTNGRFVYSFGEGILSCPAGIAVANNGQVMVLDRQPESVQVFGAEGEYMHHFPVQGNIMYGAISFHQPSEQLVISSCNGPDAKYRGKILIYSKYGEFVRSILLDIAKGTWLSGVTLTVDGRIAVAGGENGKVYVV